ncbi:MAG: hypothetical protein NVS3B14_16980 [Ktedonobacteraceae bacterium]
MAEPFIVLDPTLEVETMRKERAPRPRAFQRVGLLDNGKPNSDKLLKKIAALLEARYPGVQINYYRKPGTYRPAPNALLDQVAAECDVALIGIGD